MVDISGVVTNNSTTPALVDYVSYSVTYPDNSPVTEEGPAIDQTIPPGGSVSWNYGPYTSPVVVTTASVAQVVFQGGAPCSTG